MEDFLIFAQSLFFFGDLKVIQITLYHLFVSICLLECNFVRNFPVSLCRNS